MISRQESGHHVSRVLVNHGGATPYRHPSPPTRRSSDLTAMGTTTTSGIKTNATTAAGFAVKLTTGGNLTIGTLRNSTDATPIRTVTAYAVYCRGKETQPTATGMSSTRQEPARSWTATLV